MTHRFPLTLSLLAVAGFMAWLGWTVEHLPKGSATDAGDGVTLAKPACAAPVAWRLADVDPRFGVTREWVAEAARDAERVWGSVGGIPLLSEEADAGLRIRLVHDERQARLERIVAREAELERRREPSGDELAASIEALVDAYPPSRFEAAVYREVLVQGDAGPDPDRAFREIRVFAFRDRVDLVRILAHELGHALGLAHTPEDGAVMSAEQDGTDPSSRPVALRPPDRRALEALCSASVEAPVTR